jgi:signal peptidase I
VYSSRTGSKEVDETGPPAIGIQHRVGRLVFEVALTLAAIFGVLVSANTVAAVTSGVQPLVVRSGSMEPTIPTGSMVLTRRVEASRVQVGDIVTMERPDRTRVTHRVVDLKRQGDTVELTLKGDANKDPDPYPVTVGHVLRVVGSGTRRRTVDGLVRQRSRRLPPGRGRHRRLHQPGPSAPRTPR